MTKEDIITFLIVTAFIVIALIFFIGVQSNIYNRKALKAIYECEKELPRHLSCEAVITAKVKGSIDD